MKKSPTTPTVTLSAIGILLIPGLLLAQVPVDEDGNEIGTYSPTEAQSTDAGLANGALNPSELEELVGPVALYPDDLLAIVLPASAYPLQIASASRFLSRLEDDSSLKPDPEWDDSVVALTNYPEVIELMNDDLDWTYRLGEAVIAQQTDVVAAVESFRDRAYNAGNLRSDDRQTVSYDDGVIEIDTVEDDVIYVPYYEPRRVVVYQPRPVYYYHARPYPLYYYPYSVGHHFHDRHFWGVTTAFSIGWFSDSLHVYHHSYRGHPYYGRSYRNDWWYRRPSINVYNTTYVNNHRYSRNRDGYRDRYRNGDRWHPRDSRRQLQRTQDRRRVSAQSDTRTRDGRTARTRSGQDPIQFRERRERGTTVARNERNTTTSRRDRSQQRDTVRSNRQSDSERQQSRRQNGDSANAQTRRSNSRSDASSNTRSNNQQERRRQQTDTIRFRDRTAETEVRRQREQQQSTRRSSAERSTASRQRQTNAQRQRPQVERRSERQYARANTERRAQRTQTRVTPQAQQRSQPPARTATQRSSRQQPQRANRSQPTEARQSRSRSSSESRGERRESRSRKKR